jgi:hypothetical protein
VKKYLLIVGVLTLIRVVGSAVFPLSGDEAYYWDCSRHLDWSYFDQPPLVIWAMVPFRAMLGETALAVRAPAILASVLLALFLIPIVRRLGGGWRETTWAYLLLQIMPIYFLASSYASTDVVLVTAYAGATWAAIAIGQGERRAWWGFGIAAGLGFLAKFPIIIVTAALIPALRSKAVRADLKTATPWLAAALSLLLTLPVWIWGAQHHWANILFQLTGRHSGMGESGRGFSNVLSLFESDWDLLGGPKHLLEFIGANLGLATPFLFVAMLMALWASRRHKEVGWSVYRVATLTPLVFWGLIALKQRVGAHWGAPALALGVVAIALVEIPGRKWMTIGAAVFCLGICLPALFLVSQPDILLSVPAIARQSDERLANSPISYLYGGDEVVEGVRQRLRPGELVGSDSYTITHLLGFDSAGEFETRLGRVLGRGLHGLASLYWHTPEQLQGADMLFLTDEKDKIGEQLRLLFARCDEEEPIRIFRQGRMVRYEDVLRCKNLLEPVPTFTRLESSSSP